MTDKDLWAVQVGPVVVGGISDRKPESSLFKLVAWCITAVLFCLAIHPFLAFVSIIVSAMIVAAQATAPADNEGTHP